jgi:hypothetical protein
MTKPLSIGFPAGLFGEEALRLDIIQQGEGWFAFSKPGQIPFDDHPWQNGETHLIGAIRSQLEAGKPEIVRLGLQEPASAFGPEPEVSGVAVIADRSANARRLAGFTWDLFNWNSPIHSLLRMKMPRRKVASVICRLEWTTPAGEPSSLTTEANKLRLISSAEKFLTDGDNGQQKLDILDAIRCVSMHANVELKSQVN